MAMDSMKKNYFLKKGRVEGRIIGSYLKSRLAIVCLYLFITAVFLSLTALYGYGNAFWNMLYAVVIVVFFGALYAVFDYRKYRKKCLDLFTALVKGEERMQFLPEGGDVKEQLYRQMLMDVEQEKKRLCIAYDEKKKDMMDYYTMWIHQVKTPIAALRLLLLEEGEKLEELFKIEQYAEMALTYARLESVSSDLLFQYCDVRNVVKQALKKHFVLFSRSGLSLHLEEFSLRAVTDEKWLLFVVGQVLSNAVKYTPVGGNIWFRIIGLKQRSSQFEHIKIEVEDDGYGMTPEYLERIFDAFTRAENSTTNKVQGTGLGMAITKNIVELMGGTIDVSSEVNKGSLFRVDLEFRIPEEQTDRRFWRESGISRMLVLDGDAQCAENIKQLMQDMDVAVDTAQDAGEAMRLVREADMDGGGYGLVLVDCDVPELDAAQTAEQIRECMPEALLLFVTESEEEVQVPLLKKTAIMAKPFFVSALKEKVVRLQSGGTAEQEDVKERGESLEGLYFLAAEDNEINAEILREILAIENAACEIVENGQLAVERFAASAEGEFDAILMDVQMPVMNGYEATKAIRAMNRQDAGEIPIIAMTANAFAEDEKEALRAGMNVHLAKPVNVELLKAIIRQYVIKK